MSNSPRAQRRRDLQGALWVLAICVVLAGVGMVLSACAELAVARCGVTHARGCGQ